MGNGFISDTFSERSERPEGGRGMELIYYLIPFIVYLYDMDNINTEIIKPQRVCRTIFLYDPLRYDLNG